MKYLLFHVWMSWPFFKIYPNIFVARISTRIIVVHIAR
jgi:hypothetical protein